MASVLLVPYDPPGHAEPMLALGQALLAQGHRVTVFAAAGTAARMERAGLPTATPTRWSVGGAVPAELLGSGDGAAIFRHLVFGSVVDMTLDVEAAAVAADADVIVTDAFVPGGGLAAQRAGLPWVSLSCSPIPAVDSYVECFDPEVRDCFHATAELAELGVPAEPTNLLDRTSPYRHLIPSTPRFADFPDLPAHVSLVGPLVPVPAAEPGGPRGPGVPRPDRPTVAVTASTMAREVLRGRGYAQDRYLRVVVSAMRELPVTAVLTAAPDHDPSTVDALPENVRQVGPMPHDALFDRCTAVVTHAGWGTVGRALVRGLPLVLVPIVNDQPYIGRRCQELGLGIALDPLTVTVAELRDAIRAVCEEPTYRRAAAEFAAELRAATPLATAASFITSLLTANGGPAGRPMAVAPAGNYPGGRS